MVTTSVLLQISHCFAKCVMKGNIVGPEMQAAALCVLLALRLMPAVAVRQIAFLSIATKGTPLQALQESVSPAPQVNLRVNVECNHAIHALHIPSRKRRVNYANANNTDGVQDA